MTRRGDIRYVSANRALLEDVRHLAMSVGIRCANVYRDEIESQFGTKVHHHTLWSFICTNAQANERIGSHTDFYRERLNQQSTKTTRRHVPIFPYEAKWRFP